MYLKNVSEYLGFLFVTFLVKRLSVEAASRLGGFVLRAIGPKTRRHRVTLQNIASAFPEKSDKECENIALDMWEFLGRVFSESIKLDVIAREGRVTIDPVSLNALPKDQSFIVAGAHQGNWEVAAIAGSHLNANFTGIYRAFRNPFVDRSVFLVRKPFYPGGLWKKGAQSAVRALRCLKSGGSIAVLADVHDRRGVPGMFFGRPTKSSSFPALAAYVTGRPLFAAEVIRCPDVHFIIRLTEVRFDRSRSKDIAVSEATLLLQSLIEASVRENPGQWLWSSNRWVRG